MGDPTILAVYKMDYLGDNYAKAESLGKPRDDWKENYDFDTYANEVAFLVDAFGIQYVYIKQGNGWVSKSLVYVERDFDDFSKDDYFVVDYFNSDAIPLDGNGNGAVIDEGLGSNSTVHLASNMSFEQQYYATEYHPFSRIDSENTTFGACEPIDKNLNCTFAFKDRGTQVFTGGSGFKGFQFPLEAYKKAYPEAMAHPETEQVTLVKPRKEEGFNFDQKKEVTHTKYRPDINWDGVPDLVVYGQTEFDGKPYWTVRLSPTRITPEGEQYLSGTLYAQPTAAPAPVVAPAAADPAAKSTTAKPAAATTKTLGTAVRQEPTPLGNLVVDAVNKLMKNPANAKKTLVVDTAALDAQVKNGKITAYDVNTLNTLAVLQQQIYLAEQQKLQGIDGLKAQRSALIRQTATVAEGVPLTVKIGK